MKRHDVLFLQSNLDKLPPVEDLEFNLFLLEVSELINKSAANYRKVLQESVSKFYLDCIQKISDSGDTPAEEVLGDDFIEFSKENDLYIQKQAEFLAEDDPIEIRKFPIEALPGEFKKANLQQTAVLKYFI